MGKKRGHGDHRHKYPSDLFYPGMGPMHRIPGPHGHHWDSRGAILDPRSNPTDTRGPPADPRMSGCPMRKGIPHMFGRHHRRALFMSNSSSSSSSSSDSSSDSDTKCKKKCGKRRGRHFKHQMRQMMSDPNWNKVQCTLCWRQIRPLAETEVLECGHLYHRLCLKELFAVSQSGEKPEIFCTQCRQQIDPDLVTELQNRFNGEPTTCPQTSGDQDMSRDMQSLKVK